MSEENLSVVMAPQTRSSSVVQPFLISFKSETIVWICDKASSVVRRLRPNTYCCTVWTVLSLINEMWLSLCFFLSFHWSVCVPPTLISRLLSIFTVGFSFESFLLVYLNYFLPLFCLCLLPPGSLRFEWTILQMQSGFDPRQMKASGGAGGGDPEFPLLSGFLRCFLSSRNSLL